MITFEHARQIAINKIGPDNGLIEQTITEKPYGWYFQYQSLPWFQSRDWKDALIDDSGFIVERANGRAVEFPSGFSLKRNFAAYEYGLKYDLYDLYITEVFDAEKTALFLKKLRLTHMVTEEFNGSVRRVATDYMPSQLAKKLMNLPCIFDDCHGFSACYEIFLAMDEAKSCKYQFIGRDVA